MREEIHNVGNKMNSLIKEQKVKYKMNSLIKEPKSEI